MGRKRTYLELSAEARATIARDLGSCAETRTRERLEFALKASSGKHTLEDLARLSGRSRSTIQNWVVKLERGGLEGLISRKAAPGRRSRITEAKIQRELVRGLKAHRWSTAQNVASWLKERHGIGLARKSVYYWLRKLKTLAP